MRTRSGPPRMALFVRFRSSSCLSWGRSVRHSGEHPERNVMSTPATALLVIDVQESFRHRPYWRDHHVPLFVQRLRALIDGAEARKIPVLQIFHVKESGPFSMQSGYVVPLQGVLIAPE